MIFTIIGVLGLIFVIIGLLQRKEKKEDIFFLLGGILLIIYSIYSKNTIFIILQAAFIIATVWELIKIGKKKQIMKRTIITKDFILRPFKRGDEISLAKNINNKKIVKNTSRPIPYPYTEKDGKLWIEKNLKEDKKKKPEMINFVIDIDGEAAGSIGFENIEEHKAELGYWLAEKYWNRGIMTKAMKLVTRFGFEKLGFKRLYGYIFLFNKSSKKMIEKAGFKLEGILRKHTKKGNKLLDSYLFAKIK